MAKTIVSPAEKKNLLTLYLRSFLLFFSFNMVKMQGQGFLFTMWPILDELYKDDPEGKKEALMRHCSFYNTHACADGFIVGLTYAMEKEKMEKGTVDDKTISSIKVALMGPLAGIFDSLFFNCIRIIAAGIAIGLCSEGNVLGVILFILIYGGSFIGLKWWLLHLGYSTGVTFIDKAFESGLMESISKAASILGLMIVGGMVAQMVNVPLAWTVTVGQASVEILSIIDSIMPGLLSVLLLFGVFGMIKKGVKPVYIVLGIMVVSVLFALLGVF